MVDEELLRDAAERAVAYLAGLPARPVVPSSAALAALDELREPVPEGPTPAAEVLARLDRVGSPATVASAGPRYFGFVTGGSLPATTAASWLASAWDQNVALSVMSPAAALLEEVALGWCSELLGLPATCSGAVTTGATMANATALAAARHALLARAGRDVERDGLFGAPEITVVVGDEVHVSVLKALSLLGFGHARVTRVPADAQGRMRADALPELSGPAIVCLQAGNVNTGACDEAAPLIAWAHAADAWVHVDGAFGLWAAASPAHAPLVRGIEQADSWVLDAHKWPNVPYDCGIALVRDAAAHRAALHLGASYLVDSGLREPSYLSPEFSRSARGVLLWASLASLGRSGLAELVERTCAHARRFADGLSKAGCEVLNDVVLNQVLVRFGDAERTARVIAGVQHEGTCWAGQTTWHGVTAMRISVSSWATTAEDVERSLAAILRVAAAHPSGGA